MGGKCTAHGFVFALPCRGVYLPKHYFSGTFFPQELNVEGFKGCMAREAWSQHAEQWAAEAVLAGSSTEQHVVPVLAVSQFAAVGLLVH